MRLLLDTHALIWWLASDSRLSKRATDSIRSASRVAYSPASLWEMAIKISLNKRDFAMTSDDLTAIPKALEADRIPEIPAKPAHFECLAELPFHHGDPFDRMLIAIAKVENLRIVSKDRCFSKYGVEIVW